MTENERLYAEYVEARTHWSVTEREHTFARYALSNADQARKAAWGKLEAAAAALPVEVQNKVAAEEFGLCEDEGCPQHGTPHVCISTASS